jgi:hypothetical protein
MSLIVASYIALALFVGYSVAVGLSMAATFGISAASRNFVAKNNRISTEYKYVQDAMWLVCCTAGGYVAAVINGPSHFWLAGAGLVTILVGMLWMNAWEMRQRGLGHQILMSLVSIAGVAAGFFLHLR